MDFSIEKLTENTAKTVYKIISCPKIAKQEFKIEHCDFIRFIKLKKNPLCMFFFLVGVKQLTLIFPYAWSRKISAVLMMIFL